MLRTLSASTRSEPALALGAGDQPEHARPHSADAAPGVRKGPSMAASRNTRIPTAARAAAFQTPAAIDPP